MLRKAFVMEVNPDKHEEYEKRHNPVWQEMEDVMKAEGLHNYSIFLLPETNQLFGYVEVEDEESFGRLAKTDVCQRWWKYMKDIMPSNPDNSPISSDLREVFHMD